MPTSLGLDRRQRAELVAEIVVAYARARRELRRAPIEEVVGKLREGAPAAGGEGPAPLAEAQRLGHIVVRTLRFLPGDTRCLRRSLVLTQLLARRGISARLVIGARTAPDFLAHAWVEHDGTPVLSPEGDSFGRLVEL
ncbi:MAG TPA: lasso peptide biosynthesis B2 protein [Solirubrobacterales bacterium]|nr:lasso peptide biosynthesis B2 protein [Solirubrobacterales bacterium]